MLQLLDLLASRGVAAWVATPDVGDGHALLLEFDGFESAMALLISRGFRVTEDALPGRVRLTHTTLGDLELHPAGFADDLTATRTFADGAVITVPGEALVTDAYGPGRARQVER